MRTPKRSRCVQYQVVQAENVVEAETGYTLFNLTCYYVLRGYLGKLAFFFFLG